MFEIPIYTEEKGLEDLIRKSTSISFLSQLSVPTESSEVEITDAIKKLSAGSDAERKNFDLFPLQAVLVSSVWNDNDDTFLPEELWAARNTAKDKPFNYEHNCDDIIGHTTNSYVIDSKAKVLDDTTKVDELPELIHIISQAVLYKCWSKEDKQERMDTILSEIKDNKWFVSVECLFPDFDYIVKDEGGLTRLIARNKETSFLTKYLRIYGGTGVFRNEQVGRVPRKLILSGKGLVKKPANPSSIIFAKKYELSKNNLETAYKQKEVNKMNEKEMQENKDTIAKLQAELIQLKASQNETVTKEWQGKLEASSKLVEAANQEISVLKTSVEKVTAEKVDLVKQHEALAKEKKEISDKLDKIEAEAKFNERIELCVNKLGLDKDKAKTFVEDLSQLTSEAFTKHVEFQVNIIGKASKIVETTVTDTKVLDTVVKTPDASLNVTTPNVDVNQKLCAQLNEYMTTQRGEAKDIKPKFQRV